MPKIAEKCIFCGSSDKLTREHIFGKWLKSPEQNNPQTEHMSIIRSTPEGLPYDPPKIIPGVFNRPGAPGSHQIKIVCKSCNIGWMGETQERAKPQIEKLVAGQWSLTDIASRSAVTNWALMVAMGLDYCNVECRSISDLERNMFKFCRVPSINFQIYIGLCSDSLPLFGHLHRAIRIIAEGHNTSDAAAILLGIDKCFILVLHADYEYLPKAEEYASRNNIAILFPGTHIIQPAPPIVDSEGSAKAYFDFSAHLQTMSSSRNND